MSHSRSRTDNPESERRYPPRPVPGVGAVIVTGERHVVLVRRKHEPLAGHWSLPGGTIEVGEPAREAILREVREETGLTVTVGPVVDVIDHISFDAAGRVEYHFVLTDFVCHVLGGTLAAASDAADVVEVPADALGDYALSQTTLDVIRRALEISHGQATPVTF